MRVPNPENGMRASINRRMALRQSQVLRLSDRFNEAISAFEHETVDHGQRADCLELRRRTKFHIDSFVANVPALLVAGPTAVGEALDQLRRNLRSAIDEQLMIYNCDARVADLICSCDDLIVRLLSLLHAIPRSTHKCEYRS